MRCRSPARHRLCVLLVLPGPSHVCFEQHLSADASRNQVTPRVTHLIVHSLACRSCSFLFILNMVATFGSSGSFSFGSVSSEERESMTLRRERAGDQLFLSVCRNGMESRRTKGFQRVCIRAKSRC